MGCRLAQDITLGPSGKQPGRDWFLTQSSGWGLSCREASHTRDGFSSVLLVCSASRQGSAAQVVVKGVRTLLFGITPQDPTKAFFCLPSGWKSGLLWFLVPSSQEGLRPCPHLQGGTFSRTGLFCSVLSHRDLFL